MAPFMRARLGAVDGHSHIAVAAFAAGDPVGIARLIAIGEGRAELAVEVVDAWQGRGIGTRLVRAVVEHGRVAGLAEIVADVLAENVAMRLLLASVFPDVSAAADGPEITYAASVPTAHRPAC
jgi:RimJ/RimL family protein N-acetyltransferase